MAAFYHDSRQRRLFEEGTNRNGIPRGPSACEIDLLEWSPGDPLAEGRIIETNAQALRSRAQPRLQILFAPLDLAYHTTGAGIQALLDHYHIPSDFIAQRLESVTHSFSAIGEGSSYYSYFHFLCKHVTVSNVNSPAPGIADIRGTELSQGDWTWIRTSVFMRWEHCNDKHRATVTLIIFSASPELRDRCQRLWESDLSTVLVDPFGLFVICFNELWLQAQRVVNAVGDEFSKMERIALDLALSSKNDNGDSRHDFVGLHNIAKHIIYLKENSDAASLTVSHLQDFHRELMKQPPQGEDAMPTMRLTSQMLVQTAIQCEVWKLRMSSMKQRMRNIINLSFNVVIQHDSHVLKNDSKSMKAIATVTMAFLPLATIAAVFGSQFFDFDPQNKKLLVTTDFWIFWALIGPLSLGVSFLYYYLCYSQGATERIASILKSKNDAAS